VPAAFSPPRRGRLGIWLTYLEERRHARRESRRLRRRCQELRRAEPGLAGRTLYGRVLARHYGLEPRAVDRVLRRALESRSNWDSHEDVKLRDVALYLIVEEYLRRHPERLGARAQLERVVARTIPEDL
jgi:hypothetical protein